MQFLARDPGRRHFVVSLLKSGVRILACVMGIVLQSITVMAILFLVAEVLGIIEEIE